MSFIYTSGIKVLSMEKSTPASCKGVYAYDIILEVWQIRCLLSSLDGDAYRISLISSPNYP